MVGEDEALLRQEVVELTSFVQRDPTWADLRAAIVSKGLRIDDVFMAGFYEDEIGNEYGGLVTTAGEMFEFQRSSERGSQGFVSWERVADIDMFTESFPAAATTLRMATGRRQQP
jgi:hypothetical protein